tara:strand:+ start:716 stop:964 length:249 start_codon:yes stop_codon:yes gene_type:complete
MAFQSINAIKIQKDILRVDVLNILGLRKSSEEPTPLETEDESVNIHTLYKHRWVWYHLILCIQLIISNILLIAILVTLALKL